MIKRNITKQTVLILFFVLSNTLVYLQAENVNPPDFTLFWEPYRDVCSVTYVTHVEGKRVIITGYGEREICTPGIGGCYSSGPCEINWMAYPEIEVNP